MSLSKDEVDRIARLARLAVRPEESLAVIERLNRVLGMIETMRAVDTHRVEPMSHALDVVQRLRADEVTEPDQRGLFQAVAPSVERDLYLVPKVIE
jgi:aspartyl-tRNA(Asn)/glutamyl-tRNA(Gln) amidotransferase subunit C